MVGGFVLPACFPRGCGPLPEATALLLSSRFRSPLPLLSAELVTALAVASLRVLHHPFWFLSALPLPQINSSLKFPLLPQLDLGLIKLSYGFSSDLLP